MKMRVTVCVMVALVSVTAAFAQPDFGGLDVPQYPAPAPVQKGGLDPVQGLPVMQVPQTPQPAAGYAAPLAMSEQPEDAPGAAWSTSWSHRGHHGYRWYPGYSRHNEWASSSWYNWNYSPSYRTWYGHQGYGHGGWYGTDFRWYGLHPAYRPHGWRDRTYPYAWSPSTVIYSW